MYEFISILLAFLVLCVVVLLCVTIFTFILIIVLAIITQESFDISDVFDELIIDDYPKNKEL